MLHGQALVENTDPVTLGEKVAHDLGGEWGAAAGSVRVAGATCDVHAWPDGLRLDAYAETEAELGAAERAVSDAFSRLGAKAVDWRTRPSTLPGAPPPEMPVYHFPHGDEDED